MDAFNKVMGAFSSLNENIEYSECKKDMKKVSPYDWFISADEIFASDVIGFQKYSKFFRLEFRISRFPLFDSMQVSDSAVTAEEVKIYMAAGRHCAMLQGRMAKGIVIPKITLKKTSYTSGGIAVLETKEFSQCVIKSFEQKGEVVMFSFCYASYSDSYTDYKDNGEKLGTAATKIDLANWKVENS